MKILKIKNFSNSILMLILLSAMLNGCSIITPPHPSTANLHYLSWSNRNKQLQELNYWNIRGSLSITYNNKTDIASFEWKKSLNNYLINIRSPLNLVSATIVGDSKKVILQQSSGKQTEAHTAEELMRYQLGWALPISNLNYWIRGLPTPHVIKTKTSILFDNYNHINVITQQNWQITYLQYGSFSGIDLPTKIYLTSTSPQSQLHAKIVIKQWQTNLAPF